MAKLRILVADDHEIVRRGTLSLLEGESDLEICGEAVNGRDAVDQARARNPDIVILDIGMPSLNGLEAARQILKEFPQTKILILTVHESEQVVREVLDAGARGFILKSDAARPCGCGRRTAQEQDVLHVESRRNGAGRLSIERSHPASRRHRKGTPHAS